MISNLLCGAGIKILSNVINTWIANRTDEIRSNFLRDQKVVEAHVQLAKEAYRDWW